MSRIACIDFGLKRMGIAVSDERKSIALPSTTLHGGLSDVIAHFSSQKSDIETIVIGLPLLMNGTKGEMALRVEKFAKDLEDALSIPIILFDERLSSKHADKSMKEIQTTRKKRTKNLDQVAAALLLQSYLDQKACLNL